MTGHTWSEWAAVLSLAVSLSAGIAMPFLLWVDADYLLVADWQAVRDRVLVEVTNARLSVRDAAISLAALHMLLSPAAPEASR